MNPASRPDLNHHCAPAARSASLDFLSAPSPFTIWIWILIFKKKKYPNRVRVHVSSGKEKTSTMVTDFAFREDFRSLRSQLELAASLDEKLKYVKPTHRPQTTSVSRFSCFEFGLLVQNPH